jgi:large subunit ribosomal protein L11
LAETGALTALGSETLQAYEDKTFKFTVLPPPSSWFLKRCAGITKGASSPGKESVGTVSLKSLYEIAKVKQQYDPTQSIVPIEGVVRGLCGVAKSMGLKLSR